MNNAESFVRILFHGLFIIARNNRPDGGGRPRWEVGLPKVPTTHAHEFLIKLRKVNLVTGMSSELKDLRTPPLITLRTEPEVAPGLEDNGTIDKLNDTGNVEHFRWLIDMESELHNEPLSRRSGADYLSRLHIEGGILYTYSKTVERYKRFNIPNVNVNHYGRFAGVVAIEIKRSAANIITIDDGTPDLRRQDANFRYELDCTHLPRRGHVSTRSHFPHYYNVLADRNDPDGTKYDLVQVDLCPPTTPFVDDHHIRIEGRAEKVAAEGPVTRAVEPQVCNSVLLGRDDGGLQGGLP